MPPRVVVIIDRLSTTAGGEATLVDYVVAFAANAARVHVVVGRSSIFQRLALRLTLRRRAGLRSLPSVHPASRVIDFRVAPSVYLSDFLTREPARRATALRFLLDPRRNAVKRAFRRTDLILMSQSLTDSGIRQLRSLTKLSASLILNHNGEPADFFAKWQNKSKLEGQTALDAYTSYLKNFDSVLFQSLSQELRFRALYPTLPVDTGVIWPSLDEEACRSAKRKDNPFVAADLNLLCVAKFQSGKHQRELIEAFIEVAPEFPHVQLTFVGGESSERGYLESCVEVAQKAGMLDRIRFTGPRPDALAFIAHCNLLILPSSSEGVSRAVREGAFFAKPILCTRLPGLESFLGKDGALYLRNSSIGAISRGLRRALSNPAGWGEVAEAAKNSYTEKSSWETFEKQVGRMIRSQLRQASHS